AFAAAGCRREIGLAPPVVRRALAVARLARAVDRVGAGLAHAEVAVGAARRRVRAGRGPVRAPLGVDLRGAARVAARRVLYALAFGDRDTRRQAHHAAVEVARLADRVGGARRAVRAVDEAHAAGAAAAARAAGRASGRTRNLARADRDRRGVAEARAGLRARE